MVFKGSLTRVLGIFALVSMMGQAWAYPIQELRSIESDREKQIRELREAEVNQIRITLGRRIPKNRKAELYFRLAESYLEGYHATFLLEGRVHEARLKSGRATQGINRDQSHVFLKKGIAACEELKRLRIPYGQMDRVYYFMAFNYEELGQTKKSQYYYQLLIKNYPQSAFAVEGYREFGNAAYAKNRFRDAVRYYEAALHSEKRLKEIGILPEVLYRLSWAYYRIKQYDRAVDTMKRSVVESKNQKDRLVSIYEESLQALAIFLTETGRVKDALAYFEEVAGDSKYFVATLRKLGEQYERNAKTAKAIEVYETILRTHPEDDEAFIVSVKLIEFALKEGKYDKALARLQKLELRTSGSEAVEQSYRQLKNLVRKTATLNHEAFRKTKKENALRIAKTFYEPYLSRFAEQDRKEATEIKMYLAEVELQLGNSDRSAKLYEEVLASEDPRYSKEAGALWVDSLWDSIHKAHKTDGPRAEPSELEKKFVRASDELAKVLVDSRESRESSLRAAQVLAGYSESRKEAYDRAHRLLKNYPNSLQGVTAAKLLLQIREDELPDVKKSESDAYLEKSNQLRELVIELESNQPLLAMDRTIGKGQLNARLSEIKRNLRIGSIAVYESEKRFDKAAAAYENFAQDSKDPKQAQTAYRNALESFMKARDFEDAERMVLGWEKRFPKNSEAILAVRSVATQFLILGEFQRSASLFRYLGMKGNDSKSLVTAIRIKDALGDLQSKIDYQAAFQKIYPRDSLAWGLMVELAKDALATGQSGLALQWLARCQKAPVPLSTECFARAGDIYLEQRDTLAAKKVFDQAAFRTEVRGKLRSPYVGYSRYQLARLMEEEQVFQPLRLPEAALQRGLAQRLKFFERLTEVYRKAGEAGGPWGVASLGKLAQWTMNFALEVEGIEPNSGASDTDLKKFRSTLNAVANPLKKKALETFRRAYELALKEHALVPTLGETVKRIAMERDTLVAPAQGSLHAFRPASTKGEVLEAVREKLIRNPLQADAWVAYGSLLRTSGQKGLALLAFQRALTLEPRHYDALTNSALVSFEEDPTDWVRAAQARDQWELASKLSTSSWEAHANLGALYNYFQLFRIAQNSWEHALSEAKNRVILEGLAVAQLGQYHLAEYQKSWKLSEDLPGNANVFSEKFSRAVWDWAQGKRSSMEDCLDHLGDLSEEGLSSKEIQAMGSLKEVCELWKKRFKQ